MCVRVARCVKLWDLRLLSSSVSSCPPSSLASSPTHTQGPLPVATVCRPSSLTLRPRGVYGVVLSPDSSSMAVGYTDNWYGMGWGGGAC